ncbi:MAG: ABC transporter ATP-binding protein [Saprospiraceae bacterium]
MEKPILKASGIQKSYGDLSVLKGVNLELNQSEILSIIGKSGSGKSTLLHICGTLDRPDNGELIIKGESINSIKNISLFRNKNIGFVFQFHHLLNEFNALENIIIPALIARTNIKEAKAEALRLMNILQISERQHHKPNQLSGGEQQRVALARALINKPAIIFADEPTGNLDSQTSTELHNLIFDLRNQFNLSFVIVTHNMELAQMSDRFLTMKDGILL